MEIYDACKGVEEIRTMISYRIANWPKVSNGDLSFVDDLLQPFDCLLSLQPDQLKCREYKGGYYIGEEVDGKFSGMGMWRSDFLPFEGMRQMEVYIGEWNEGKPCGPGVVYSMKGSELEWYIMRVTYNSDGEIEGSTLRIDYRGARNEYPKRIGTKKNQWRWFLLLGLIVFIGLLKLISPSQDEQRSVKTVSTVSTSDKEFDDFIHQFLSSASFQYSRIHFPIKMAIEYSTDDGEIKSLPMTKEAWPLLSELPVYNDGETFGAFKVKGHEGMVYELGYLNSELTLRLIFKKINKKWFVVDGGNWDWYPGMDMTAKELAETRKKVQEHNAAFLAKHP